jgi:hypothetical protein
MLIHIQADFSKSSTGISSGSYAQTSSASLNVTASLGLADQYTLYLWSYCASNSSSSNCTNPIRDFLFDPIEVWHLNDTSLFQPVPKILRKALDTYQNLSGDVTKLYIVAVSLSIHTLLSGFFAAHLWSIFPFIASAISTVVLLAAAILVTVAYGGLVAAFNIALRSDDIHVSLGWAFNIFWAAFLSSFLAACCWLIRCLCCCCT